MIGALTLLLRTLLGVLLSWTLGYFVFFVIFFVVDFIAKTFVTPIPNTAFIGAWFTAAGVAAGAGVYLAWLGMETRRGVSLTVLVVVLLAGIGGAWTGYFYGTAIGDPFLFAYPWRRLTVTPLIGASLAANVVGTLSGTALYVWSHRGTARPDRSFFRYLESRRW